MNLNKSTDFAVESRFKISLMKLLFLLFVFHLRTAFCEGGDTDSDYNYDSPPRFMCPELQSTHECCAAEDMGGLGISFSKSTFSCDSGCCGDRDNQHCCGDESTDDLNNDELTIIIVACVVGGLGFIALVVFLVWICKKMCRGVQFRKDHKETMKGLQEARTLDELFEPAQPLIPVPGTIVHPVTHM